METAEQMSEEIEDFSSPIYEVTPSIKGNGNLISGEGERGMGVVILTLIYPDFFYTNNFGYGYTIKY